MRLGLRKRIDRLRALIWPEDGQDLVEYAMILALIATGATAAMQGLSSVLLTALIHISTVLGDYSV